MINRTDEVTFSVFGQMEMESVTRKTSWITLQTMHCYSFYDGILKNT